MFQIAIALGSKTSEADPSLEWSFEIQSRTQHCISPTQQIEKRTWEKEKETK